MIQSIKYLIIIFLFFSAFTLYADSAQTDSLLLKKIEKAKGEKKLELMFELANVYIISTEKILDIANWIEQEALEQRNMRYVAGSYTLKSRHFMNQNNLDSTVYYGNLSNKTYSEYNIDNPGQTYQFMAIVYLNKGYYELAIHNLNLYMKIYKYDIQSYMMLGIAYMHAENFDLSKKYFTEALSLAELNENTELFDLITIYIGLANLSYGIEDYHSALHYCSISEALLDSIAEKDYDPNIEIRYSLTYTLYAMAYFGSADIEKGKIYLDKAMAIPYSLSNDVAKQDINTAWFEYYFLFKDYDRASNYLEESLTYAKHAFEYSTIFHDVLKRKIRLLEAQGKYKEALQVQKELINNKDIIFQRNIPLQISELSKSYELNKVRIEKEKEKAKLQRSQTIIMGFIIVTILLCSILYIVRRNAVQLKEKNKALYKQRAEVERYINLTKKSSSILDTENPSSKENSLFGKFEDYLKEKEIFRNSDLDREEIALALGTNRQYLADAVKAETGKTFMDYINDYRLDYARYQLILDDSTPITNIIQESGFSSNTTFYRLFKEKYGMTPNELRKVKSEIEREITNEDKIKDY